MKIHFEGTKKTRRKILSFVMSLVMALSVTAAGGVPALAQGADAASAAPAGAGDGGAASLMLESESTNGELSVSVLSGGQWREAGRLFFNKYITDQQLDLGGVASPGEDIQVRVAKVSGGASHLDAVLLGSAAPRVVSGGGDAGVSKLSAKDNDLIGVDETGVTLTFAAGAGTVLKVSARVESETISKIPFQYPLDNLYRPMSENSSFYTYTLDSVGGSLNLDGEIHEVDGMKPFFAEFSQTGSGHPAGTTYGWVMNDDQNLYVAIDFTSDNTMDGDLDYTKVYVNTADGLKEFKVSVPETTWGVPGFTYTDKANYQHKVYEFKIPLSELGAQVGEKLQLAFAAYGTASAPGPQDLALTDAGDGRFLAVYTDSLYDGTHTRIRGYFVDANGTTGAPFDVADDFDAWLISGLKVAYDGSRFLVVYGYDDQIYGRFISSEGVADDNILEISEGEDDFFSPAVAYGDGAFLVTYADWDASHHVYSRFVTVGEGGPVVGNDVLDIGAGDSQAVSYGDGQFLVAYSDDSSVTGLFITPGDAAPVVGSSFPIGEGSDPAAAYGGGQFLVTYGGSEFTYAQRVAADGTPEGEPLELTDGDTSCVSAAYSSGQDVFLVVWSPDEAGVQGRAVNPDGVVGGRMEIAAAGSDDTWFTSAAVAGGASFLAGYAYVDQAGGSSRYAAFAPVPVDMTTPVITQQPADLIVEAGEEAQFTVEAGTLDGGTLRYQWQKSTNGGANWTDIEGATEASYSVASVTPEDHGSQYQCVVTNTDATPHAAVTSDAATLSVGVNASSLSDFETAIAGTAAVVRITGNFTLEGDVTINRVVTITSDTGAVITTGGYSLIVGTTGDVTIDGNLKMTGTGTQVIQVNGGTFALGGRVYIDAGTGVAVTVMGGTATIDGGAIDAGTGVEVSGGTVTIGGGADIETGDIGISVTGGTVTIGGAAYIFGSTDGVHVTGGTVTIDGAYIEASGTGVNVENGTATIDGSADIEAEGTGVEVSGGTAGIGGDASIYGANNAGVAVTGGMADIGDTATVIASNGNGVFVVAGAATIGGAASASGSTTGVTVIGGTANITVSATIDGGVYGSNGSTVAFLTALPAPVDLPATETDRGITFAITDAETEFSIGDTTSGELEELTSINDNTVTLDVPTAPGVYSLVLTATVGVGTVNLTVPVTARPVAPVIGTQPSATTAYVGNTATFAVAATSPDSGTLSYQWQKSTNNGTTWTGIAGAAGASYTTGALALTDSGSQYRCTVTSTINGAVATTASAAAALTVNTPPSGATQPSVPIVGTDGNITATPPQLNQSTGVASSNITASVLNTALSRAAMDGNGKKTVAITIPAATGATGYETTLPASALSSGANTRFAINTDLASVTLPGDMLSGTNLSGDAGLTVGEADTSDLPDDVRAQIGGRPVIQLTLTVGGQQTDWNNPNAPVTVSIPYTPTAEELNNSEGIVIWYIDGSGNIVTVPNGRYDPETGTVTFATTHFSDYAVAYSPASFRDVATGAWYYKPVNFIAARGITDGTGDGDFSPDLKLTRGEFLVMLMRAYGIAPDANPTDNFSDAGSTYYTGYLAAAKRLGISGGIGGNLFAPDKEITRQEMFTMLYNALKVIGQIPQGDSGKTLSDFADAGQIDSWAKDALTLLVETGTVDGNAGMLTPTSTTTRAEMAQVLYNLLSK